MRPLLLFLFFTAIASAEDWFIYTYGDVSSIADVMRYLSYSNSDGTYQNILYLAIVFGLFMAAFAKKVFDVPGMSTQLLSVVALIAFIYGAKTDVNIVNVKTFSTMQEGSSYEKVSDVPFAFAFTASSLSNIGYSMARLLNQGIAHVDGDKYTDISFIKTGMLGGGDLYFKMLKTDLRDISEKGSVFSQYYSTYFQECIINGAMAYSATTVDKIRKSTDLVEDISPTNILQNTGVDISTDIIYIAGERTTCSNAYATVKSSYDTFKGSGEIEKYFNDYFKENFSNIQSTLGTVTEVYAQAGGSTSANNIQDFVLSAGMMGQANTALSSYLGTGDGDISLSYGGFGAGLANASLIQSSVSKSLFSGEQLPHLMTILNFVMYAMFPFIFIVTIASANLKILKNFLLAMLWIQLWPVTFEALSYFVNKDMINASTSALINAGAVSHTTGNMLSMSILPYLNETIAYQSAQAANLMWSVPVISGFLLSGSWTAMMGMASSIGAHATSGANTADIQRKQAEIDWEQKMLSDTANSWSPTAGELTRTGIDAEMLGLSKNSQSALKEIEALGGVGAAINTAATKSAYDSLSNQAYINRMSESDMVGVGNSKAVIDQAAAGGTDEAASASGGYDKLVDIKSTSDAYDFLAKSRENMQHINMGGGLDAASQRVSDAMFADKQLAMRVTEETLGRHGGLDNFLNQASQAKSYENYMGTQKSIGTELAFESLYAQHGGGKSREGFYQYMTSENGRAELGRSLGAASEIEGTTNTELVNMGKGKTKLDNSTDTGSYNANVTHQDLAEVQTVKLEESVGSALGLKDISEEKGVSIQDMSYLNTIVEDSKTLGSNLSKMRSAETLNPGDSPINSLFKEGENEGRLVKRTDGDGNIINGAFNSDFTGWGNYSSDGSQSHDYSKSWNYDQTYSQKMTANFETGIYNNPQRLTQEQYGNSLETMMKSEGQSKTNIALSMIPLSPETKQTVNAIISGTSMAIDKITEVIPTFAPPNGSGNPIEYSGSATAPISTK